MRPLPRLLLLAASTALLAASLPATASTAVGMAPMAGRAPVTVGTWVPVPDMTTPRYQPQSARLADGRVLVAGGQDSAGKPMASAEIFDPATHTWSPTADMPMARAGGWAALLTDGRVLVASGGSASGDDLTAVLFDPSTGRWTTTGQMKQAQRETWGDVRLPDGSIMIAGGYSNTGWYVTLNAAEIYHPATGQWTETAPMLVAAAHRATSLLPDGRVLVAGGEVSCCSISLNEAEIYTPATDSWAATASLTTPRSMGGTTAGLALPDGRLMIPGQNTAGIYNQTATVEAFDPATATWATLAPMHEARAAYGLALAGGSDALIVGGVNQSGYLASDEVYDPSLNVWTDTPPPPFVTFVPTAISLLDGSVLVFGGGDPSGALARAALFTISSASLPGAPTGVTVATSGRSASVSFAPPASDGGSPITGYQALCTSNTGGATRRGQSATAPITVPGLTAGATYTCTVTATNVAGAGPPSAPSAPFTVPTVPGAPSTVTIRVVTAGTALQVTFTAPASDGGSPITGYQAICTSSTGGTLRDGWGTGTPIRVSQVTGLSQYRCKVLAVNQVGAGPASTASARVITPPGLPGAPTAVTVTAGSTLTSALVGFTPPAWNGGHTITGYLAACTSSTGGTARSTIGTAPPVQLSGLTRGASYTCTAAAINSAGTGPTSAPSAPYTAPA